MRPTPFPTLRVARRVRAWIETLMSVAAMIWSAVARRVRAWIETFAALEIAAAAASPAACGRGLKHGPGKKLPNALRRPPRAGVD